MFREGVDGVRRKVESLVRREVKGFRFLFEISGLFRFLRE